MRSEDRFEVVFRRAPPAKGARGSIGFRYHPACQVISDPGNSLEDYPRPPDVKEKLSALLPEYSVLGAPPCAAKSATVLRSVSTSAISASSGDPEAFLSTTRPRPVGIGNESKPVIIAVAPGLSVDLESALSALASSNSEFELTLSFRKFVLTLPDQISVSRAMRENAPYSELFFQDPGLARRQTLALESLRRWMLSPSGLHFECRLHVASRVVPGFPEMISHLLFKASANEAVGNAFASEVLDLSMAYPIGSPLPILIPAPTALEDLGFLQLDSSRPLCPRHSMFCVVGETLSGTDVSIPERDLARHTVIVGSTGVGKSSLLHQMLTQAIGFGQ